MLDVGTSREAQLNTDPRQANAHCTVFALIGSFLAILVVTCLSQPLMF